MPCSLSSCGGRPCQVWKLRLLRPVPGGIGRDHLQAQLTKGSSYLRQAMGIDLAASLEREPKMRAPVTIQSAEQALRLDHFFERSHHRQGRFLFHQLRVVDLVVGVVEDHNQVIPTFILEPTVLRKTRRLSDKKSL